MLFWDFFVIPFWRWYVCYRIVFVQSYFFKSKEWLTQLTAIGVLRLSRTLSQYCLVYPNSMLSGVWLWFNGLTWWHLLRSEIASTLLCLHIYVMRTKARKMYHHSSAIQNRHCVRTIWGTEWIFQPFMDWCYMLLYVAS